MTNFAEMCIYCFTKVSLLMENGDKLECFHGLGRSMLRRSGSPDHVAWPHEQLPPLVVISRAPNLKDFRR